MLRAALSTSDLSLRTLNLKSNVDFMLGSSKQGKALLASVDSNWVLANTCVSFWEFL